MRRSRPTFLSVAALALGAWAVPMAAHADHSSTVVHCGQTVTSSIRLANSLVGCVGDGLVIGADDITVDLAGHSIRGANTAGSEGIADDGHWGVRIKNGTISRFFLNGVGLRHAPHSAVINMRIREIGAGGVEPETSAGVLVKNSPRTLIAESTVKNDVKAFQADGVDVLSSAGTKVIGNRIADNAWNGMVVIESPRTRVICNHFDGNQNQGIEVNVGSDRALLARNHAADNAHSGLVVGAISGARIWANKLRDNGDSGLFMFDLHHSLIVANRAVGNGVGIDLEGGQHGSTDNVVAHNVTSHNKAGLVIGTGASDNVVVRNVSNANRGGADDGGGLIVFAGMNNKVIGNVASHNRDVGIGVFEDKPGDATGNVLKANRANFNRNHGINAVAGTIDGGHNKARGNIPPPNCIGVSCS